MSFTPSTTALPLSGLLGKEPVPGTYGVQAIWLSICLDTTGALLSYMLGRMFIARGEAEGGAGCGAGTTLARAGSALWLLRSSAEGGRGCDWL